MNVWASILQGVVVAIFLVKFLDWHLGDYQFWVGAILLNALIVLIRSRAR